MAAYIVRFHLGGIAHERSVGPFAAESQAIAHVMALHPDADRAHVACGPIESGQPCPPRRVYPDDIAPDEPTDPAVAPADQAAARDVAG